MRNVLLFFLSLTLFTQTFAMSTVSVPKIKINAADVYLPVGKSGLKISLLELSRIKVKDLEKITDHKLSLIDRMSFMIAQKRLSNSIDHDGAFNNKKIEKLLKRHKGGVAGIHFGGLALGFFLGIIGVLIAYLINDDYKRNRVKWAWVGFGYSMILFSILYLTLIRHSL